MNNLRTESHVAQKSRRHKLRFQHNSDDPNHQHLSQDPHFELHRPARYGSISYDPSVFPSEMLNSIASNPHLLLPPSHAFLSHDQDSATGSSPASFPHSVSCKVIADNPQNGGNWKSVVSSSQSQLQVNSDSWNVVSYSNVASMSMDQSNSNSPMVVQGGASSKPTYGYNQDLQNIHLGDQKNYGEVPAFGSTPYYHNTLQEVVTSATVGTHVHQSKNFLEISQSIPCWMNTSDQLGFIANRNNDHREGTMMGATNENNCITQGLSLSLSSNSKYLKPAQELLNDNCDVGGHELVQSCDNTHKILDEEMSRVSGESGTSGASSSTIYGSNEHITGRSSSLPESYRPEFHQKKAKLLYMQEEVCRRYRQYHQQMQMVISSFETVAGLSSATPYVSLALKAVSRHFHCVKCAISEQLTQMKKTFEDLCSPTVGASSSKNFDANSTDTLSQLKSMDHNYQRQGKSGGFFGNQQPVWRPQRGLPERAVSVLKAWLFDHFLHPYPSDADKHMLATQTGLTRNQVSNWFINARVRIWKPMVEEIHTLETKGLADSNTNNPTPTDGQDTSRMDMSSLSNKQQPECSRTSGTLTMMNGQNEPNEQLWDHEKRSRPEYQIPPATMDRSFTSIIPYPRTTFEAGVGPVSLTLGLRQNAEHVQQLQQHEHQLRQRFGGQLIHDFVG
ncbi:Homeobox KN domain-containing protein [Cynara cardunculus var. scolymus]|uniref:Homeobox KN domain-containing protein n=1 Tax=Cynara cardunculus var. scolymus TaxID=59895 RepID=A0A103XHB1_CYNCS|nr:Homeobox KN domain-containing protein [Cynara cardunculus var. scolymus]